MRNRATTWGRRDDIRRTRVDRCVVAAVEAIERRVLLSAGDPDLSFGVDGWVHTGSENEISIVGLDSRGGKSVLALDTEFDGIEVMQFDRSASPAWNIDSQTYGVKPSEVKVGPRGEVYLLGVGTDPERPGFGRSGVYAAWGADYGFGDGGAASVSFDATSMAVAGDGRIVVGGTQLVADGTRHRAAARFYADGTPDTAFGGTGEVVTGFEVGGAAYVVAMPGGQVALAATVRNPGGAPAGGAAPFNPAVVRLSNAGAVDAAFGGGDGVVYVDLGAGDAVTAAGLTPGGNILVGAGVAGQFVQPFRVAGNGSTFRRFERLDAGGDAVVTRIGAGTDGRAVAWVRVGFGPAVARYTNDGALDASFNGLGIRPVDGDVGAIQDDNTLLTAAGYAEYRSTGIGVKKYLYAAGPDPLGATLDAAGTFTVNGTARGEAIDVRQATLRSVSGRPDLTRRAVGVAVGDYFRWAVLPAAKRVVVNAGGGDDDVMARGSPVPVTLNGQGGNDRLWAGDTDDRLDGGAGDDALDGLGGNDVLVGGEGADGLFGGAGDDRFVMSADGDGATGDDVWQPSDAYPQNMWDPPAGTPGPGTDTIDFSASATGVTISLGTWAGIENADGSNFDDVITGSAAANVLRGNGGNDRMFGVAGNDKLYGGAGNDRLDGGAGADDMWGGAGTDTIDYGTRTKGVYVGLGSYADDGEAGEKDNARSDVEVVIGGAGNDTIIGTDAANIFYGNGGDDVLWGRGGNDTLSGGAGRDKLYGEGGNDSLFAKDGVIDSVDGGLGYDTAARDIVDSVKGVEKVS